MPPKPPNRAKLVCIDCMNCPLNGMHVVNRGPTNTPQMYELGKADMQNGNGRLEIRNPSTFPAASKMSLRFSGVKTRQAVHA
jgi:hypothetical protein